MDILALLLIALKSLVLMVVLLVLIAYYLYADRKIWAAVQLRRGPNVVGPWGLLQAFADLLKFVFTQFQTQLAPLQEQLLQLRDGQFSPVNTRGLWLSESFAPQEGWVVRDERVKERAPSTQDGAKIDHGGYQAAAVAFQLPIRQWVFAAPDPCPDPAELDRVAPGVLLDGGAGFDVLSGFDDGGNHPGKGCGDVFGVTR